MNGKVLMGLREYARHRNTSLSSVQKAIASGRITTVIIDGAKKIDPITADQDWKENTKASPTSIELSGDENDLYFKSRAEKEKYLALLAKLEYERKCGDVLDKDETRRTIIKLVTETRDALLNIPDRIAPELVAINDIFQMTEKLRKEIYDTLLNLSRIPQEVKANTTA